MAVDKMYSKWLPLLTKCKLFEDITPYELNIMLECLSPKISNYVKNETIKYMGEDIKEIGLIISGTATISKENASGNRVIMDILKSGDVFGEVAAFSENDVYPATVTAQDECTVMKLPSDKVAWGCQNSCPSHKQLATNMLKIISNKAFILNRKLDYLSIKSIRGKISSFLIEQAQRNKKLMFMMPLKREELAQFLNVSRPSLSREMCKMRDEGIIEFHRESVRIKNMKALKEMASL
jgi:CRP-like cAMP-binding protein